MSEVEMGSLSVFHWITFLVVVFLFLFPTIKILHKAGYSGWWIVLTLIPLANIVLLWVFAFARWPNLKDT
jgi:hypothetical protein